jgi:serine/threonine protein phosphatase PrpC
LNVLPPIHVVEADGGAVVLAEALKSADAPEAVLAPPDPDDALAETLVVCRKLHQVMMTLHDAGCVWLNFDPFAIESHKDRIRATNMDWRLFRVGECPSRLAKVSPHYSPPEVCCFRDDDVGPATDVFHLAMFAYLRLARLWPSGFAGKGLEAFRFEIPPLRIFRPDIPVGVWSTLHRGLSINPAKRHPRTADLLGELEQISRRMSSSSALEPSKIPMGQTNERRRIRFWPWRKHSPTPSSIIQLPSADVVEVGQQTIAGRAKSQIGAVNQDAVAVSWEHVAERKVLTVIVADGVTHAKIGTGDQASQLACDVVRKAILPELESVGKGEQVNWNKILKKACIAAGRAIVSASQAIAANAQNCESLQDNDLMSSTAIVAILDGRELHLANVGDSRAYLVTNGIAEQLTVDGDVATTRLQQGTPPEEVQDLGTAGKALRYCLGAARKEEDGRFVCEDDRASPQISRWDLNQGDTVVLCSDGLVEEGVFLEPEDLVRLTEQNTEQSAQQLAERLVAEADARQRLPSESEPGGFGDNISCVVLRGR